MRYQFVSRTTPLDFWKLSMYSIYGSLIGVCNILFTVAMVGLIVKFWGDVNHFVRILLILASCLFPVIQPIGIYIRAKRQADAMLQNMEIDFDDSGIHVRTANQTSDLKWNTIKRVSKKPSMMVIFSTATHGFILTNKVLGKEKENFYNYVVSKLK